MLSMFRVEAFSFWPPSVDRANARPGTTDGGFFMKLIPLTQGQFAKVDDEDFARFGNLKWYAWWNPKTKSFYARRNFKKPIAGSTYLHRAIMNEPTGLYVDHRNHDTLDDQKNNLRSCSNSKNQSNRSRQNILNTSGFRGVTKSWKKWKAQIQINGVTVYLGTFSEKNDAAAAYAAANKKYFGEFGGVL